jgi:hypothetical protein
MKPLKLIAFEAMRQWRECFDEFRPQMGAMEPRKSWDGYYLRDAGYRLLVERRPDGSQIEVSAVVGGRVFRAKVDLLEAAADPRAVDLCVEELIFRLSTEVKASPEFMKNCSFCPA